MKETRSEIEENEPDTFARRFRELAINANMSKDDLTDELNISPSALNRYLSGERRPPVDVLLRIAKYFDVSTDYLLREEVELRERDFNLMEVSKVTGISVEALEALRDMDKRDARRGTPGRSLESINAFLTVDSPSNIFAYNFFRRFIEFWKLSRQFVKLAGETLDKRQTAKSEDFETWGSTEEKRDLAQFRLIKTFELIDHLEEIEIGDAD